MGIVPAAVKNSIPFRGVGDTGLFLDRQCIDIGTEPDTELGALSSTPKFRKNPCFTFPYATYGSNSEGAQLLLNKVRSFKLLKAQLRVFMDLVAPPDDLIGALPDLFPKCRTHIALHNCLLPSLKLPQSI